VKWGGEGVVGDQNYVKKWNWEVREIANRCGGISVKMALNGSEREKV
jgi:hypothetical protein